MDKRVQQECPLLALPVEVLVQILGKLDAVTLANCARVKAFRAIDKPSGLRLVDRVAKEAVVQRSGDAPYNRWRHMSWLERYFVECSHVGFDQERCQKHGFQFLPPIGDNSRPHIRLQGMGPKLLVSDLSTRDQPYLRWRLGVRGNAAVEFGVVPLHMQDNHKVLHKQCTSDPSCPRPVGVCSMITVGSQLHNKVSLMKGSIVEVLARKGTLDVLVTNPLDGQELYWHNARTVPKPYTGPGECRLTLDFPPDHDVKLALTCWAHGAFDVLHVAHPQPLPRAVADAGMMLCGMRACGGAAASGRLRLGGSSGSGGGSSNGVHSAGAAQGARTRGRSQSCTCRGTADEADGAGSDRPGDRQCRHRGGRHSRSIGDIAGGAGASTDGGSSQDAVNGGAEAGLLACGSQGELTHSESRSDLPSSSANEKVEAQPSSSNSRQTGLRRGGSRRRAGASGQEATTPLAATPQLQVSPSPSSEASCSTL